MRKDGIVKHGDLVHIWAKFRKSPSEFESLAHTFMTLLQKMGVCFVVSEDDKKPFMVQRSIIPALLPDEPLSQRNDTGSVLCECWPRDPPFNRPVQIERIVKFSVVPGELVSRLLVQLHTYIQKSLVGKYEVVIVMEGSDENTQGWIRVEPERNRFVVMVRGSEVRYCIRLQEWILNQVKEVCSTHYLSVLETKEEWIRSPHFSGSEIALTEVMSEVARGENERVLMCPETRLPIRAEKLLMRAGMTIPTPTSTTISNTKVLSLGRTLDHLFLLEVEVEVE